MSVKFDRDVPIPSSAAGRPRKSPAWHMQPGDSTIIPIGQRPGWLEILKARGLRGITRSANCPSKHVRIWCVEKKS
jgi:hypothetical protein